MDMAGLPATQNQLSKVDRKILETLANGASPAFIAKKLAPDDKAKQKRLRNRIRRLAAMSPELVAMKAQQAQGEMILGVDGVAAAVVDRAKRGRMDAAKLVLEATGVYTPHSKTSHEHSGEISINLKGIPRPAHTVEEDHKVMDAEVVEDTP